MMHTLYTIALHEYLTAALLLLSSLVRPWRLAPLLSRALVGSGILLHSTSLGALLVGQGGQPIGLAQACSSLSLLLVLISFGVELRYRLPVIGAFLLPFATAVMVPGL